MLADPNRPLKLGPHGGEDFVDLLLRLVPDVSGPVRQAMTLCLMSYQDPRTTRFMVEAFSKSRDSAIVLRLGQRLLLERGLDFFRPFLWEGGSAQALAAAMICQSEQALSRAERLRIALLLPGNPPVPAINPESLPAWLAELQGPHRAEARRRGEERSTEALLLWAHWEQLGRSEQDWLLTLTARVNPEMARDRVEQLLEAGCLWASVIEQAHAFGLALPPALLEHQDPRLRALAVSVGLADADLARFLQASVEEGVAATGRCTPEVTVGLLSDPRWQVRARAVQVLAESSYRPLEEVKLLLRSDSKGERIAAIELLRYWGEEAWLERNLLNSGQPG